MRKEARTDGLEDRRLLPEGWQRVRLGQILTPRNEILHPHDNPKGAGRFVGLEHVESHTGVRRGSVELDLSKLTGRKPKFHKGDIVYGYLRPYLNKVWLAEFDGFCSVDQYVFQPALGEVDGRFISWFLRSPTFLNRAPVGTTPGQLPRIRKEEVASVEIELPPLSEQRHIAAVLAAQMAAVERARAAAGKQLRAAKELPPAYLRAEFEGGAAKQWPWERLDAICDLLPSKSISSNGDCEVQSITTACLTESGFDLSGIKSARMQSRDAAACVVTAGEILVARSNTAELVGRTARVPEGLKNVVASDLTIRILPRDLSLSPFLTSYLSYLFLSGYWRERAGGASGSMKKITRTQIASLSVPSPDRADQDRISARLAETTTRTRTLVDALKAQLASIDALPAALLRQAFAGRL